MNSDQAERIAKALELIAERLLMFAPRSDERVPIIENGEITGWIEHKTVRPD